MVYRVIISADRQIAVDPRNARDLLTSQFLALISESQYHRVIVVVSDSREPGAASRFSPYTRKALRCFSGIF